MRTVLQKEYTLDLIEFAKWQEMISHRKTFCGKLQYYSGKVVAVFYIIQFALSVKNIYKPDYKDRWIHRTIQLLVHHLGLQSSESESLGETVDFETEDLAITISIQYVILAVTAFLIVINVQGFFRRLLVTLKNILRDNQIQISFHTTVLIFSFIMGTYYLSIILSLSMQLPEDRR